MEPKSINEVDNTQLEDLLTEFAANHSKEIMNQIVPLLGNTRVLMQADFPPEFDRKQLEGAQKGKPIQLPEGAKPIPAILKNGEGEQFFGVYTGYNELPKENKFPFVLDMTFLDCCKLAKSANLEGIVVNAFTQNVAYKRKAIEAFVRDFAEGKVPQVPSKEIKMTTDQFHDITRRNIELHLLPFVLFKNKKEAYDSLCQGGCKVVAEIFSDPYKKVDGLESPYKASDFSMMDLNLSDDLGLVRIDMPEKDLRPGQCISVYVTYSESLDLIQYYTIHSPRNKEEGSMLGCVFEIEEGKTKHEILEPAPNESAQMQRIVDLAQQQIQNRNEE